MLNYFSVRCGGFRLSNVNAAVRGGGHHNGCSPEMLRLSCENTRLENGQRRNVKLGAYFFDEIRISAMVPDSLSELERSSETYSFDSDSLRS
ncbi:hypothetical protein CASFOL_020801 [Castilleja foliolosa]|uniref:Uncharacterized protein n=1 Tax=Castilleja foliolosa TaxID=1961234 RepID=A0ABD3D384_9LAMI